MLTFKRHKYFGNAIVHQIDFWSIKSYKDILWFKVSMYDTPLMDPLQNGNQLRCHFKNSFKSEPLMNLQVMRQILTQQFQH